MIAEVIIEADGSVPTWTMSHFLQVTNYNYMKMYQLRLILEKFNEGACDSDFSVGQSSFDLYNMHTWEHALTNGGYYHLASKSKNAENFWEIFGKLHRPIVLYRNYPIYLAEIEGAFHLKELSHRSPVKYIISGTLETFIDLITGRYFRKKDIEFIEANARTMNQFVELINKIEDPQTPPLVREFMRPQIVALQNKQRDLNKRCGILPSDDLR